ncbi:selenocysteine insertion sequence-binding protein 2 isoform X2 [Eleutherodactylus coqui]|uniref:selenocysteine insertion sequence-binding protein 2 isoform X2 n=1 Tax=Eleutherodactylus coqui TaxID=57060 RepID=UPI0034629EBB
MSAVQPGAVAHISSERPLQTALWARKVKQPPKNVTTSPTSVKATFSGPYNTKDPKLQGYNKIPLTPNRITEAETGKVVTRKKKKKKNSNEVPEAARSTNENIVYQKPPKFEDDEEFPHLISSTAVKPENKTSSGSSWGPRGSADDEEFTDLISSSTGVKPENKPSPGSSWGPRGSAASTNKTSKGKKSKERVQLDLGGMLAALEQRQTTEKNKQITKPLVLSVGSGVPVKPRQPAAVGKSLQSKQSLAPHNPLDSSSPLVKKGKQREVPKAKKPTSLKKIILKEREQRKQLHLLHSQDAPQQEMCPPSTDSPEESQALTEMSPPSPDQQDIEEKAGAADSCAFPPDEPSQDVPDTTEVSAPAPQPSSNLPKIHSRRFREYCSQVLSKEVDSCVTELLKELVRFQDRLYLKDPVKAKTKRRLVMGLREVLKHLKLKKLKCIIISPNCEKIQSKGGLDDTLQTIINCACEQNVPFVFALNRKALGHCVNKAVPVSVVGVFSYDGAQDHFHKLYDLTMKARQDYTEMINSLQRQPADDEGEENDVEAVSEDRQQESPEVTTGSSIEETDEPNYIKVWRRMLEEKYTPYAMSLEESVTDDMFNFHL